MEIKRKDGPFSSVEFLVLGNGTRVSRQGHLYRAIQNRMCTEGPTLMNEKRKFTRTPFETEIRVVTDDHVAISHRLRDISLGGAFIALKTPLPEGAPCILHIDLIGPKSLLKIEIEGEVVRKEQDGMAVRFTRIDLDSLVHLRHLIKVHSQDPETIDVEFAQELLKA